MILHLIFAAVVWVMSPGIAFAGLDPQEPLYPIFENDRWGLIDRSGKVVLPPRFEGVGRYGRYGSDPLHPHLTSQVAAFTSIMDPKPITDSVIPIRLDGKAGLVTRDGEVMALGRYEDIKWETAGEGRIVVRSGGRYGYAGERGDLVIPPQFDMAKRFEGGYAFVKADNRWGVIDLDGRIVVPPTWDEVSGFPGDELAKAAIGDRWGVIDRSGKVVIPFKFDEIGRPLNQLIFAFDSGWNRSVYVRHGGSVAFEIQCPRGGFSKPKAHGGPFFGKHALVTCGERRGLIDMEGHFLLEPTWDGFGVFGEGRATVCRDKKYGIIDYHKGTFILEPTWDGIIVFEEGRAYAARDRKSGIIDYYKGEFILEFGKELGKIELLWYQEEEGLLLFRSHDNSELGYLDREGHVVIPPSLRDVLGWNDGLGAVRTGKKEGYKVGYIDRTGSWIIKPQWRQGSPFRGPLTTVAQPVGKDAQEIAYIDRTGNVIYRMRFTGFINP